MILIPLQKKILEVTPTVDVLGLVEGETVTHLYPITGNEHAIGHNIFKDSLRKKEVLKALAKKDIFFAGPYQLLQGGSGIVGRLPIFVNDKYYGFATVLINLSTFLKIAGLDHPDNTHYTFQLSKVNPNTGKEEFFLPQTKSFNTREVVNEIIPAGDWHIYATFTKSQLLSSFWPSLLLGFLFSVLAGILAWYITRQPIQLKKMLDEKIQIIRRSEEEYTSLFNQAMEPIFVMDNNGALINVNESICSLLDYTREELLQMKVDDIVDPEELKNNPVDYSPKLLGNLIFSERRMRAKNGNIIELEISKKQISHNRILAIARDVTDLRKVQKRIALSESTLSTSFEHSAIGMVMVSLEGKYLRTNIAFTQMTGYSAEELMSMSMYDITYKDDIDADKKFIEQVNAGVADTFKTIKRYVCKNGSIIWVKLNVSVIRDAEGKPLFFVSQSENITEQKKAEQEIQKLNRLYYFISEANEFLLRAEREEDLFEESCRIAVELGGMRMAWVGIVDENNILRPLTWYGHEAGYLKNLIVSTDENRPSGNGPSGRAIRNKSYYFCNNVSEDPAMAPWRADALERGYHASISFPVLIKNEVRAVFTMYISDVDYFNDTEIKLLQEVVDNIAFTLEKIEVKALHQKAEIELAESDAKFKILVEQSLAGVYILQENKFIYVNPAFEQISGYTQTDLVNHMSFDDLIHEDDLQMIKSKYNSRISGKNPTAHYTLKSVRSDGAIRNIEIIVSAINFKDKLAVIGTVIDITDRMQESKRIEQAIIDAQEKERLQIGMELHDNVKQILAGSILHLEILKNHLDDYNMAAKIISNLKNYNNEAIDELRRLSHQLAPSLDSKLSLADKIKILVSNMNVHGKLDIFIDVDLFDIDDKLQLTFYRIIQEQLTNIIKYAHADRVKIIIKQSGTNVLLEIADDGKGFDTTIKKEGIGLENIRRRTGLLNGKTKIISSPGQGCKILIEIPDMLIV